MELIEPPPKPTVIPLIRPSVEAESLISLPVVLLNKAIPFAVAEDGPTTSPPVPVALIVIEPAALVIVTPEPAVNVVRVKPVPLPMSNAPLAGVVVKPVPPFATATVPVTLPALPEMLPVTCEPSKLKALNVVSVELLDAVMFAAVPVVF